MSHDTRQKVVYVLVALIVVAMVLSVTGCTTSSGDSDASAPLTTEGYPAAMSAICAATTTELDELPEPPTQISRADWVAEVARILGNEAAQFAALRVSEERRGQHGSLERTAREQAEQLVLLSEALNAEGGDASGIESVSDEIRSLSIGRDELAVELGVPDCGARALA